MTEKNTDEIEIEKHVDAAISALEQIEKIGRKAWEMLSEKINESDSEIAEWISVELRRLAVIKERSSANRGCQVPTTTVEEKVK